MDGPLKSKLVSKKAICQKLKVLSLTEKSPKSALEIAPKMNAETNLALLDLVSCFDYKF